MAAGKKKGAYAACAAESVPVVDGGPRCREIEVR
jgi:hypothetical protein